MKKQKIIKEYRLLRLPMKISASPRGMYNMIVLSIDTGTTGIDVLLTIKDAKSIVRILSNAIEARRKKREECED